MPDLPGLWSLSPLGAVVGLLVLLFWMLTTGRLMTRAQHTEIVKTLERFADVQQEAIKEWRLATHELTSRSLVAPTKEIAERVLRGGDA